MDTKVKGIVLKAIDFKDNDKLLTILTLEKGKIIVKARGVKKASSKLKAYCQSFCFADFELIGGVGKINTNYVLSGVNEIDNFFDLLMDIEKFNFAFAVLEIADKICFENQIYVNIFVDILKCLKQMAYGNSNAKICLIKFILNVLNFEGVNLNLNKCNSCSSPLMSNIYLDLKTGEVLCPVCKTFECIEIEKSVFSSLKIISNCSYEKLNTIKLSQNILDKTLSTIVKNLNYKFDFKLKSIEL